MSNKLPDIGVADFCEQVLLKWAAHKATWKNEDIINLAGSRTSGYTTTTTDLDDLYSKLESYVILLILLFSMRDTSRKQEELYEPIGDAYLKYIQRHKSMTEEKAIKALIKSWRYTLDLLSSINRGLEKKEKNQTFYDIAAFCLTTDWRNSCNEERISAIDFSFLHIDLTKDLVEEMDASYNITYSNTLQ